MVLETVKQPEMGEPSNRYSSENRVGGNHGERAGDSSAKVWITQDVVRTKQPTADLRQTYRKVMSICVGITFVLHTAVAVAFPKFESDAREIKKVQHMIEVEDLPETQQIKRPPPPPRPAVPIETESADVPDDVTIESTDLDFDDAQVDLPPPPPPGSGNDEEMEEEIVEFWAVEQVPEPISQPAPEYPEVARKAGLTGTVFVEFTVSKEGRVTGARVVRGPTIFHEAALAAIFKFVFKPAMQNDKPVGVRMTQPIRFRLKGAE